MPRGKKKVQPVEEAKTGSEAVTVVAEASEEAPKPDPVVPKAAPVVLDPIAESRKVLSVPLDPSQEFFESPEGYIVIGEKGRGRVWCRQANKGAGMWVNPRR